ncbi:hypothetical protein [Streptomyces sp. NPDC059533]|uniref:hypothetical protein n=1 Tax=Streptomyces sp. NPDC059533 TaxID=3346858 RepID=UPI0036A5C5C3
MVENAWRPVHQAVESSDHVELTRLLDEGANVNEVGQGMTLLEHAIDLEVDSALQSGVPIDSRLTVLRPRMSLLRGSAGTCSPLALGCYALGESELHGPGDHVSVVR